MKTVILAKFQSEQFHNGNFQMDKVNPLENKINSWTVLSLDVKTLGWMTPFTWCGLHIGQYLQGNTTSNFT